jgi:hypothetical protein
MKRLLTFLLGCATFAEVAPAALFQYQFTAKVTFDAGSPLVEVNDVIHGTFAYDAAPTTAFPFPTAPQFHTWDRPQPPIGITVFANGMTLTQNPDNFAQISVLNDDPIQGDQFEFSSFIGLRNAEDPMLYSGGALFLVLHDGSGGAFDSTTLPTELFSLADFSSATLTVYDGVNPYFSATITDLVFVPEPTAITLLAVAAFLTRWNVRRNPN